MPFPFLPAGAVVAASILLGALTAFGLILRAMDKALVGLRDNVLSGLVSGLRTWSSARPDRLATASPGSSTGSPWGMPDESNSAATSVTTPAPPAPELVDLGSRSIDPEPVRRR